MMLDVQFLTMVSMIAGGFYLGIALDTFRRFTPYWKNKVLLTYFLEITFWLTQALILYYLLFQVNYGELRVYIFVAILLGFAMYQALAAKMYKRLLEKMISIILWIYRLIKKTIQVMIINPVIWFIQALIVIVLFIGRMLFSILEFGLKLLWTPIKWILIGIYRLLPQKMKKIIHKVAGFYCIIKNTCIRWTRYIVKRRK